ncbi:MAG: NlpC/P60 family protein [Clostridium sp.]|uniref:C40 family peptidase n=1 Tax=Clostridium sp. TaxID=1506 RepID=UPI0025C535BF|nr:C40 family peptidase [Clostridium sp.]MCE5221767.1 NlpC/P60 family protein [Clostridium sp.]
MKKKYKTTIAATLIFLTTVTSSGVPAFAEPNELSLEQVVQNIQECDSKIEYNMDELNKYKEQILEKENNIKDNQNQLILAEKNIEETDKQLEERLKGIQLNGGVEATPMQYLDVLLSSGDFLDAVKKAYIISEICTSDKNLILEAKESKQKLIEVKENIEKESIELQKNKDDVEKQIKESEDEKEKLLKYIQENSEILSSGTDIIIPVTLPSDISDKAKAVIEESEKYLKVPYLWGGESPEGFDCSGLMQYVFNAQGIDIPRISEDQQSAATTISMSEIKPGDLVFNKVSNSTHVGMYVGNDMYIQAPHTGDIVKISKLSTSNMKYVGRILN